MIKGFSTGAIAKGDFRTALEILRGTDTNAVELSALRESEIVELIANLDALDLRQFEYVSVHAPSKLTVMTERQLIAILLSVAKRG